MGRYDLGRVYGAEVGKVAAWAEGEDLVEFVKGFGQVVKKVKERQQPYGNSQRLEQLLERAKLNFSLSVYAKYYVNF